MRERSGKTELVWSVGEGRGGRRKERSAPDSGGGGAEPCPPPVCLPPSLGPSNKDADTGMWVLDRPRACGVGQRWGAACP